MRYDWNKALKNPAGSTEFFIEIDSRFFQCAQDYLSKEQTPFGSLIPFQELQDKDVLEIGVGHGTHASLISPRCKSFHGIDLTEEASKMTRQRFKVFNLPGIILKMDAEAMSFPNQSFDFVWSWGVIHHSANTLKILKEIHRVLRPGGKAIIMVYHRSWWNYYIFGFIRGILQGLFFRGYSLNQIQQWGADGAIARHYKPPEWKQLCYGLFKISKIDIMGTKNELLPLPHSKLKTTLIGLIPTVVSKFFLSRCKQGVFLVSTLKKL